MKRILFISLLCFYFTTYSQVNTIIDTDFANNGNLLLYVKRMSSIYTNNGNIISAGVHPSFGLRIYKLDENGSTDTTFGNSGVVENNDAGDNFINIQLLKHYGNYFLVSWSGGINRYDYSGNLDTTFGVNGKINENSPKVFLVNDNLLIKDLYGNIRMYDSNGIIDTNFSLPSSYDYGTFCFGVNDKIYSSISGANDVNLISFNTDSTIYNSFGTNGIVSYDFNSSLQINNFHTSLISYVNNKILVVGYNDRGTYCDTIFLKFNLDGTIDNNFGVSGVIVLSYSNANYENFPTKIISTNNGYTYVGIQWRHNTSGYVEKGYIIRLNENGIDNTFNSNGYFTTHNKLNTFDMYNNDGIIVSGEHSSGGWDKIFKYQNSSTASINENYINNEILIYPNPIMDYFKIKDNYEIKTIKVVDITGKVIKTFLNQDKYEISEIKNGMYFLIVKDYMNNIFTEKILINK